MKHLSRLSRFQVDFQKFIFDKVKKEVDDGCRLLDEPEPSTFSRDDIDEFDPAGYYDSLCETFPTYMTSMVAATASGSYGEETMQVPSETVWPGSKTCMGGTRPEASNLYSIHITVNVAFLLSCRPPLPSTDLGGQQLICAQC